MPSPPCYYFRYSSLYFLSVIFSCFSLLFPFGIDFSTPESQVFLFLQLTLRQCIRQPSPLGNGLLGQWRKILRSRFLLLELSVTQVPRVCKSMEIRSADWIILCWFFFFPFPKCTCELVILSFLSLLLTVLNKIQNKTIRFGTPAGSWIPNMSPSNCSTLFYSDHWIIKHNAYVAFAISVAKNKKKKIYIYILIE